MGEVLQRNIEHYSATNKHRDARDSKKIVIEKLVIRNTKVSYNSILDLSLPDIELHNLGQLVGGITSAQIAQAILSELDTKPTLAPAKAAVISGMGVS